MKLKTLTVGRMCFGVFLVLSLSGLPFFASAILAQPKVPAGVAFSLPVAMTCPGQAPEGELVKILFGRIKTNVKYDPSMEPKELAGNKTLILIIGGSGKGLGAAGADIQDEVKRAEALIAEAKKQNMKLIGIHAGGEDRRGPASAKFIDVVTPKVNYLVVREDGNKDGIFTKIASENKIPLTVIKQTPELSDILKQVFGIK